MEGLKKITTYYSIMDEEEALRLDDKIRRSLRLEGFEEGMEKGLEQGLEQKTFDVIKSMLKKNYSYEDIADINGKSIKEIKEVEKSMINN